MRNPSGRDFGNQQRTERKSGSRKKEVGEAAGRVQAFGIERAGQALPVETQGMHSVLGGKRQPPLLSS